MRRPLFGNGIPRNVLAVDGLVTVFDAENFGDEFVYALTLFMWPFAPTGGAPVVNPNFSVGTDLGLGPLPIALLSKAYLDTIWSGPSLVAPQQIAPFKVLDRYMVRGGQKVVVANSEAASATCFVWGYFEPVGEQDVATPFRGLQPQPPANPFTYPPGLLQLGINSQQSVVLHQLSPQYVDLVTLDVLVEAGAEVPAQSASIALVGSVVVPLPMNEIGGAGTGAPAFRMFDGIPMRAPSNTATDILLSGSTGAASAMVLSAYGSFVRT